MDISKEYEIIKPESKPNKDGYIVGKNEIFGKIEDCFDFEILNEYGLNSISFDFFINWNKPKTSGNLNNEVWFKRVLKMNNVESYIDPKDRKTFKTNLFKNEPEDILKKNYEFLKKYNLTGRYMVIRDDKEFGQRNIVVTFKLLNEKLCDEMYYYNISQLNKLLIKNSGGKFKMKNKKLNYSDTKLEFYLAESCEETGALWPGDCDMILFDNKLKCKCILEFKKCTDYGNIKVEEQSFNRYKQDKNKYTRIGILRDYLSAMENEIIPYIVIFYPTNKEKKIKIQSIQGKHNELEELKSVIIDVPEDNSEESLKKFKDSLIKKILNI